MRILIAVTGIGFGHTLRDYALINEIFKKYPKTEIRIIGYGISSRLFKNKFPLTEIKGPKLPDYEFNYKIRNIMISNLFYPIHYLFNKAKISNIIKKFQPDILISDFEPSAISKDKKSFAIFNFNPNTLKDYGKEKGSNHSVRIQAGYVKHYYEKSNKVVIPTIFGPNRNSGKFFYTYPIVRMQPNELESEKKLMKKLKLKKKPILITIGGSNFGIGLVKKLLGIIPKFGEDFIIFGYPEEKTGKNIKIFRFKENFLEYLKVCKGIITLAGHNTLSEIIVYKKPSLIFPVRNHIEQILNAYEIEKKRYGIVKNLESLDGNLEFYINDFIEKIPSVQKRLNKLKVRGTGAEEIVKMIDRFK